MNDRRRGAPRAVLEAGERNRPIDHQRDVPADRRELRQRREPRQLPVAEGFETQLEQVDGADQAETNYAKALEIFRSIGNDFEVARTLHSLGNRLLERGDVKQSEKHLEEARSIFERIDSKVGEQVGRTIKEIKSQAKGSSKKGRSAKKKR